MLSVPVTLASLISNMFQKIVLITGPSASGKSYLVKKLRAAALSHVRVVDMDDMFSSSVDGVGNEYSLSAIKAFVEKGGSQDRLVMLGVSRNIVQVINAVSGIAANSRVPFSIGVLRPGAHEIIRRRRDRAKAFDLSLDDEGHARDIRKFDFVVASFKTFSIRGNAVSRVASELGSTYHMLNLRPQIVASRLNFVTAVASPDKKTRRLVFQVFPKLHVVVKQFPDPALTTVKFWTVDGSSLEKTMSFWNTKEPWEPSDEEVAAAKTAISSCVDAFLEK